MPCLSRRDYRATPSCITTPATSTRSSTQHTHRRSGLTCYCRRSCKGSRDAAQRCLASEKATCVADVAYRWGFTIPSYFSQEYKRLFGHSPSRDRRCPSDATCAA
ncbi:MAG: AraC family transcriptional regulator [Pseudomonadales bacterium]|nr:AraC family transcriptional regulator [Pseudomonadales bacterium]MBH2031456.1 AraC family transcriptional regulator [Pseudomonadales bacterium]MBH2074800.1 AraC family transcriptional regulator [Pseudomonadales bacterium]